MNFLDEFKGYEEPYPVGVLLPEIKLTEEDKSVYEVKDNVTNNEFLRAVCRKKVKDLRIDKKENAKDYYARIKMELDVFEDLGFVDYILLNWDIIGKSKEKGIPIGAGRGSAAGSLVLYLIGVTDIDSLKHELFFERFVSKSRAKKIEHNGITYLDGGLLPDVDNDIAYDRRQEVIDYIENQYKGKTAKILTINTLTGKLCIKECGKLVAELSEDDVNLISSSIPKLHGKVAPLDEAYEESEKFKDFMDENPEVFRIAKTLEGLKKNFGVHPSGIAISKDDIKEIMPLQLTGEGEIVTGYDMNAVAELAVKFDVLGLRTLSVIHDTLNQIGMNEKNISVDDPLIYENLQDLKEPQGLFQIEADTNFKVCKDVRPLNLEHLSAILALARPGALDYVEDFVKYRDTGETQLKHELFEDVLDYTGGIALYQEQLMKMATKIGFSLDEAEMLRRIVGKKKVDEIPKWKAKIEEKIKENNLDPKAGEVLWKVAEDSASYSFNKSHSLSYAYTAARTVWLKVNYPKEFYVSLLKMAKSEPDPYHEIQKISQELKRLGGIKLLKPSLIKSKIDFSVEGDDIRFGLNCIKGVAEKSLNALVELRDSKFENKFDLFNCSKEAGINIGVLSSLVYAGALDCIKMDKKTRGYLALEAQAYNILTDREKRLFGEIGEDYDYMILDMIKDAVEEQLEDENGKRIMKDSRFETFKSKFKNYKTIYTKNMSKQKFAHWYFEKSLLGYAYSSSLKEILGDHRIMDIAKAEKASSGKVRIAGTVTDTIAKKSQTSGNPYFKMIISDETGECGAMIMDNKRKKTLTLYKESGNVLPEKDDIVIVEGGKSGDMIFIDTIERVNRDVYLKFSEIK